MEQPQSSPEQSPTFVRCMSCTRLVKLPPAPDPNAIVKCPRCGDSYPIAILLEDEIPEMEVVNPGVRDTVPFKIETDQPAVVERVEIEKDDQNRFVVPSALSKGAKRKKRKRRKSDDSEPETKVQTRESRSSSASETRERKRSRSTNRHSRRDSAAGEAVKVVFGALLAPPVAQLVIWWVLGLDPLGLGPVVSKVVPGVVPAKFRAIDEEEREQSSIEKAMSAKLKKENDAIARKKGSEFIDPDKD